MALNNSGPISLGGPTVGQSINLELGNSATALASINSTQFRTLAGVASGTIALSNFYGKSNSVSYVTYFIGTNSTGEAVQDGKIVLSNTGYMAVTLNSIASTPTIGIVEPSGAKATNNPYSYSAGSTAKLLQTFGADWTTLATNIIMNTANTSFNLIDFAAPQTRIFSTSPADSNSSEANYQRNISRDASGNLYRVVVAQPNPKYEPNFVLRKYNSSGTIQWFVAGGTNFPPNSLLQLLVQSDGTPIWVWNSRYVRVFTNTGAASYTNPIATGLGESDCVGAAIDANNVIWLVSQAGPTLRQVNAARTSITGYNFSVGATDGYAIFGIAHYNGYIYIVSRANSIAETAAFYIAAFSSTDGTEYWTKKVLFTGVNTSTVSNLSAVFAANCLQANSQGLAISFTISCPNGAAGGTTPRYMMRFPLNGALTTTTYNNIAASAGTPNYIVNMSVSTVARTWSTSGTYAMTTNTTTAFAGTSGSSVTNVSVTDQTGAGYFNGFKQNIMS